MDEYVKSICLVRILFIYLFIYLFYKFPVNFSVHFKHEAHVLNMLCYARQTKFFHPGDAEAYPTHSVHLQQCQTAYHPISSGFSTRVVSEATRFRGCRLSYARQECSTPRGEEV